MIAQREGDHAESEWNSRDHTSAESGLCYRQDTVMRFLLLPATQAAPLFHAPQWRRNPSKRQQWVTHSTLQMLHFFTFPSGSLGMNAQLLFFFFKKQKQIHNCSILRSFCVPEKNENKLVGNALGATLVGLTSLRWAFCHNHFKHPTDTYTWGWGSLT